jgi:hypothetical protein
LQALFAPLQALCPLQALAPGQFTLADAEVATKVVAANTAAAVTTIALFFIVSLPVGPRRQNRRDVKLWIEERNYTIYVP